MTAVDADSDIFDVSPEQVDEALETLWRGRSRAFEKLLDGGDSSAAGVNEMFGGAVSQGLPATPDDQPPTIANFTILGELGRGGMGVIYEARQHHPARLVALKVIRSGHSPKQQQIRLFQREIESLARLKHAGIAAIYEAGVTDDGRPFFAMELIRGKTLLEFARGLPADTKSESMRIRAILHLFEKICDAINYAHQRGVIHRDLKPSNVMVADESQEGGSGSATRLGQAVKVLDFGLARITDADVSVTVATDAGQIRGTLAYMAPEQIRGDQSEADIRSDVYSLGILLFEMLTGRLPYDIKHTSVGQVIRVICETSPTRPSVFCPDLRGDLETILFKALSKECDQRYQNVSAFAEDVSRFLSNQPILARPQSSFYQLRKLVARHRVASFAVFAVVVVSAVGFVVSTSLYAATKKAQLAEASQRKLAEQERDRAVEAERLAELRLGKANMEAEKAMAVTTFVAEMLASPDPDKRGRDIKVIDVLDRAAEKVDEALKDQPEVQASIRHVLGVSYVNLSLSEQARAQLEQASELRTKLLGPAHVDTQETNVNLAMSLSNLGQHDDAEALMEVVLANYETEQGDDAAGKMRALTAMGSLLYHAGKLKRAQQYLEKALGRQVPILGESHKDTLVTMSALGIVLEESGKYKEAEQQFRRVLEHRQRVYEEDHPRLLVAQENLASAMQYQGKLPEAEKLYRQILQANRRVMGNEHTRTLVVINDLAKIIQDQGQFEAAEPLFRENYETRLRVFGREQQGTLVAANNLAAIYKDMKQFSDAETLMRETIDIGQRILPEDHWYHSVFQCNLGVYLMKQGKLDEAQERLEAAHAGLVVALGAEHPRVDRVKKQLEEARQLQREAKDAASPKDDGK